MKTDPPDPYRCSTLATEGKWSSPISNVYQMEQAQWQPASCMQRRYTAQDIKICTSSGASIVFVGDSIARQLFFNTASKLNKTKADNLRHSIPKHTDIFFSQHDATSSEVMQNTLKFYWDPYFNLTHSTPKQGTASLMMMNESDHTSVRLVVVSTGLWHARYLGDSYLAEFNQTTRNLRAVSELNLADIQGARRYSSFSLPSKRTTLVVLPVLHTNHTNLTGDRAASLTTDRISKLDTHLQSVQHECHLNVPWSFQNMTARGGLTHETDGVHIVDSVASAQSEVLLNYLCNDRLPQTYPYHVSCCVRPPPVNRTQRMILMIASAVILVNLAVRMVNYMTVTASRGMAKRLTGNLSQAVATLAAALLYCFAADRTGYLDKVAKKQSTSSFLVLSTLTLLSGIYSTSQVPKAGSSVQCGQIVETADADNILPREQTEEWKGWMQVLVLLYHYFGMSRVLWVYQLIRLLVASYLFMTGYGHTIDFLKTGDFSFRRMVSVLFRLNVLSCVLTYLMRTDYDFYYFPALCSFWFVVVYITLHGTSSDSSVRRLTLRILTSMATVCSFVLYPTVLETFCSTLHKFCQMNINARELRFRVSLDLFIVYVGMTLAISYVKAKRLCEYHHRRLVWLSVLRPTSLVPSCFVILGLHAWLQGSAHDKYASNRTHPIGSVAAVLAIVGLRNATRRLRTSYSPMFAWVGRLSLETFILQYHIWLAGDTKGLLQIPWFVGCQRQFWDLSLVALYWLHFTVVTAYFVWVSWAVSRALNVLTNLFVGSREEKQYQRPYLKMWSSVELGNYGLELVAHQTKRFNLGTRVVLVFLLWFMNLAWSQPGK